MEICSDDNKNTISTLTRQSFTKYDILKWSSAFQGSDQTMAVCMFHHTPQELYFYLLTSSGEFLGKYFSNRKKLQSLWIWLVGTAALGASVLHLTAEEHFSPALSSSPTCRHGECHQSISQEIWALPQLGLLALITPVPEAQQFTCPQHSKEGDKIFTLWCWLAYSEGWSKLSVLQIHLSAANPQTEQKPNDPPIPRQSLFRF